MKNSNTTLVSINLANPLHDIQDSIHSNTTLVSINRGYNTK